MPVEVHKDQTVVVFDGDCGLCSRSAAWLVRRDRHHRLTVLPWQTPGLLEATGLTEAQVTEAAWTLAPDGTLRGGQQAILTALQVVTGGWLPLAALFRVPLLSHAADAAYRWIAANRGRFPGAAYCALGPPPPLEPASAEMLASRRVTSSGTRA